MSLGEEVAADRAFAEALALDGSLGARIAEVYWSTGLMKFDEGNLAAARRLFGLALQYKPALAPSIATCYLKRGKKTGDLQFYAEAISLDPKVRVKLCPAIIERAKAAKGQDALDTYAFAHDHGCMTRNAEEHAGQQLLEIAQGLPAGARQPYLSLAETFIGKSRVDQAFPPPGPTPGLKDTDLQL